MRLIKILGLVTIAAVAALAFVGTPSASAEFETQLCYVLEGLECPEGQAVQELHMTLAPKTVWLLSGKSPNVNVKCSSILELSEVLSGDKPQEIHTTKRDFSGCELEDGLAGPCTIVSEQLPILGDVLKTGLNEGVLEGLNGETHITCKAFGIIKIDCVYAGEGVEFNVFGAGHALGGKNGMLNAAGVPLKKTVGGSLCSETSEIVTGLFEPSEPVYLTGGGSEPAKGTALCKAHSTSCAKSNLVKNLHMATTKPPVLLNSVANVECEESLAAATVLGLGFEPDPQEADVMKLTWSECHTQGAADNCAVSSESLPTLDIERSALNVGTAETLGGAVHVECDILGGLVELDCVYNLPTSLSVEGALQSAAAGHGRFSADKAVVKTAKEEEGCPETAKWDLSYEASEHVYIVE